MARVKKTVVTGVTREQMEDAFGRYASADAEVQSINAAMDKQFVAIREKHADRLAVLEQDKLLANREDEECQQLMEDCGILVAQDETFYVEPKKEKED